MLSKKKKLHHKTNDRKDDPAVDWIKKNVAIRTSTEILAKCFVDKNQLNPARQLWIMETDLVGHNQKGLRSQNY